MTPPTDISASGACESVAVAPAAARPGWLRAVSYVLSACVLAWVVWQLRLDRLASAIADVRWPLLALAVALGVASVALQSLRWWYLMRPGAARYGTVLQATYLGSLANQIFPLRPGEIIRGVVAVRNMTWPLTAVLSTEAIERVCDAVAAGLLIWVALGSLQVPTAVHVARLVVGIAIAALLIGVTILAVRTHRIRTRLQGWVPQKKAARWSRSALLGFIEGLEVGRDWKALVLTLACAGGMVAIQITIIWLALAAYGLPFTLGQASVLLAIITTGTLLPSAPGNVGPWQFFCLLGLSVLGVDATTAAGFSIVAYAVLSLGSLAGGIVALAVSPFSFGDLRRLSRHREQVPAAASAAVASTPVPEAEG